MPTKKDFAGKTKTSKTYDKDWVFSGGAWTTQKQAKADIANKKEAQAYKANLSAQAAPSPVPGVPGTPPASATAPIDTSGLVTSAPVPMPLPTPAPSLTQTAPDTSIPNWWIGNAITNPSTPEAQFANVANALLPTLAPEDQRTLAGYLSQNHKDVFGGYSNTDFGSAPTAITDATRKQYLNPQRAQLAISLLDRMQKASGATEMGAGYDFLKNAINLINQFAVDGVMTREKYGQFTNAVSSLTKNAGQGMSSYANLAQLFNLPQFTAGPLISNTPNSTLFV